MSVPLSGSSGPPHDGHLKARTEMLLAMMESSLIGKCAQAYSKSKGMKILAIQSASGVRPTGKVVARGADTRRQILLQHVIGLKRNGASQALGPGAKRKVQGLPAS